MNVHASGLSPPVGEVSPSAEGIWVVWAQHALLVGQQLFVGRDGTRNLPRLTPPAGEVASGTQGVGVVWAQHPLPIGQQLFVGRDGTRNLPRLTPPAGEVVPGGEGVWVVWAQHALPVGQQLFVGRDGTPNIPRLTSPAGEVASGTQGVRMVWAQTVVRSAGQLLEVMGGGCDLTCLAKAVTGEVQRWMCVRPVQGVFGTVGEGVGVGAQGLGKGGVALDVGPSVGEGVGGGVSEQVALLGVERVAGSALDELVDADGLVWGAGGVVDQTEAVQGAQRPWDVLGGGLMNVGLFGGVGAVLGEVGEGGRAVQDWGGDAVGGA
jgi:hypothetical protein